MLQIFYDGLRRLLYRPLLAGLQEVKGVRPDQLHDKFKRDGAPAAPSVGPPRPPGFGPPRPPAAAGGGTKAAATGEEADVGPPRPPADEDGEEDEEDAGGYPGEIWCWGFKLQIWAYTHLVPAEPRDPYNTLCPSPLLFHSSQRTRTVMRTLGYCPYDPPLPPVSPLIEDDEGDEDPWLLPVSHEVSLVNGPESTHSRAVTALDIDHTGSRVVTGGLDYMVRVYDFNGMKSDMRPFR